jgi:hypothetical protein
MSGFHYRQLNEYKNAVIEEVELLGSVDQSGAESIALNGMESIEYGYGLRLSPVIIAADLLGIKHCCAGVN